MWRLSGIALSADGVNDVSEADLLAHYDREYPSQLREP